MTGERSSPALGPTPPASQSRWPAQAITRTDAQDSPARARRQRARKDQKGASSASFLPSFLSLHLIHILRRALKPQSLHFAYTRSRFTPSPSSPRGQSPACASALLVDEPPHERLGTDLCSLHALKHPPPSLPASPCAVASSTSPFTRLWQKHSASPALHCKSTGPDWVSPIPLAHTHPRTRPARLEPRHLTDPRPPSSLSISPHQSTPTS